MPGGNGTGPWWAYGRWNCRRGFGRGWGLGRGSGFGRGYMAVPFNQAPQISKESEISELKYYANELKSELEEVKKRILDLEKSD